MENRILELRIKQKMSVEEVSQIVDIPIERIREIENNNATLTNMEIKKFSILFNVQADELYKKKAEDEAFKFEEIKVEDNDKKEKIEKAEKIKEKKTFFNRPLLIVPPILMALLFLFMALPCYGGDVDFGFTEASYSLSIFDLMLSNADGNFLDDGLAAIGIIMIILNSLSIIYFICSIVVGKETLKKLEKYNVAVLGLSGVINLAFAVSTIIIIGGTEALIFCGIMSYFIWFAYSFYAVVVSLIGLHNITKSSGEIKKSNIKDGFTTKSRYGLLFAIVPLIIETVLLAVISLGEDASGEKNEIFIFFVLNLVVLALAFIFYMVIIFVKEKTRAKLRTIFDVVNGAVILFNLIWLICAIPPVLEEIFVMTAINIIIFSLYYLLHITKKQT
ncbi:MAG TPA: helix-turn-helix transcriptional regulator [Candidatus Caccovivens faecavium]|nr:helix-turn-helix transcriptional regulator [Candidatus Caccovivens faecavium]